MDFVKVDGNKIIVSYDTKPCKNCGKHMIGWHEALPKWVEIRALVGGLDIVTESYGDFGICKQCVSKGDFPRRCESCSKEKSYPREFKYELTRYAKYPEEDTEFLYVCKECVKSKPGLVMDMLVDYDDSKDLEKDRD